MGFDFLGKNIRKYDGRLLIKPFTASIKTMLDKVRDVVKRNPAMRQDNLIHNSGVKTPNTEQAMRSKCHHAILKGYRRCNPISEDMLIQF